MSKSKNSTSSTTPAEVIKRELLPFIEKSGMAKGLIHIRRIDNAIIAATEGIVRECIHSASELDDRVEASPVIAEWFAQLMIGLQDKVWTGRYKAADDDTSSTKKRLRPVKASPRGGLEYQQRIIRLAIGRVLRSYTPRTPKLKHHADARRFLTLCKMLFPNVKTAADCANGLRCFIENVHNSCGTEGATFVQKALWLLSSKTGGTGKSFFISHLKAVCERLGIDCGSETFNGAQYVKPAVGLHTVTISEDTPKLNSDAAELLNLIIDRSVFHFNIKFGADGNAQSCTNLVLGSNYESFESNVRRYNVVSYMTENVTEENAISKEERSRYFPLWGDDKTVDDAISEMIEVAPFRGEHPDWSRPAIGINDAGEEIQARKPVPARFAEVLEDIQYAVRYIQRDPTINPGDNRFDHLKDSLDKQRPSAIIKAIVEVCGKQGPERAATKAAVGALLAELKSRGQLGYRGKQQLWNAQLNWLQFENFVAGDESSKLGEEDPLEDTAKQWDALIGAEE